MNANLNVTPKKRNRVLLWSIIIPIIIIFFSIVVYGSYLYLKASSTVEGSQQELKRGDKSDKRLEGVMPIEDNTSVLFMGVDHSLKRDKQYGDAIRTDALLLATFNKKQNSVKLVSIPRDTYTFIEAENKKDKITHAHVFGGVDATVQSVEELLNVPVDYFVKINFEAFMDIVNALGGIKVDVPISFTEQNSKDVKGAITIEKGLQTLDGEQALAVARTRKIDSDVERGKRQQLLIQAIIDKMKSVSSVTKYGKVIDALGDNLSTNLSFNEMMSYMNYVSNTNDLKIENLQIKGESKKIGKVEYYIPDMAYLTELQTILNNHLDRAEPVD